VRIYDGGHDRTIVGRRLGPTLAEHRETAPYRDGGAFFQIMAFGWI
jgi:hypothetical protein